MIPEVLYEFDGTRPYLPSSPYYSEAVWEKGSLEQYLPENHLWGPRGYYKDKFYTTAPCTFVSEIGYHGCPNRSSLEKMMTAEGLYPWTEGPSVERRVDHQVDAPLRGLGSDDGSQQSDAESGEYPVWLGSRRFGRVRLRFAVGSGRGNEILRRDVARPQVRADGHHLVERARRMADHFGRRGRLLRLEKLAYYFLSNVQKNVACSSTIRSTEPIRSWR